MLIKEKLKLYYIDLVKGKNKGMLGALFSFVLLLLSFGYGLLVKLVSSAYQSGLIKSYHPDCRVISVGNITWGGTGKTPLVKTLTKYLKDQGKKPAILIRGYGTDETEMFKDKFKEIPILADRDRVKSAKRARGEFAVDTIVLDDGFQHWRLKRDLDIVLIDATLPFGNARLIPCGILREPLSSLARADIFILTKTEQASPTLEETKRILAQYSPQAPVYEAKYLPRLLRNLATSETVEFSAIKGKRIAALAGIAHPQSFTQTLTSLGAEVVLHFYFPDHYQYTQKDLENLEKACHKKQVGILVTTEKDVPRLFPLLNRQKLNLAVWVLGIEFKIVKDEMRFFNFIRLGLDTARPYSILILSDARAGHLNQSKGIANIVQRKKITQGIEPNLIDTKIKQVQFKNRFFRLLIGFCAIFSGPSCRRCLVCLRFCLSKETFNELMQSPANLIISTGSSLAPVNLFLSYKNKAHNIVLMKPSLLNLSRFNLVIVPEHDQVKPKANVLITRVTPNLIDQKFLKDQAEALKNRLQTTDYKLQTGGPTIGVLIGGDSAKYSLPLVTVNEIISQLKKVGYDLNAQILITTSRRTRQDIEDLLKQDLADFAKCKLLIVANENNIPEAVGGILGLSDIIIVSGESISMVSEAISAEKYVLVFMPEKKTTKKTKQEVFLEGLEKDGLLKLIHPHLLSRDIEKIWRERPLKARLPEQSSLEQAIGRII